MLSIGRSIIRLSSLRPYNSFNQQLKPLTVTARSSQQQQQHQDANHSKNLPLDTNENDQKFNIKEEEKGISGLDVEFVPEKPILSLGIPDRLDKMTKTGSMTVDMFITKFDTDFLTYPECLDNRNECARMYEQYKMIYHLFPKIWWDSSKLQQFNFNNLYELSVTEMMHVLEGVGASARRCYETNLSAPLDEGDRFLPRGKQSEFNHINVTKSMISLIIKNCLTYYPIIKSNNESLRKKLTPQTFKLKRDFQERNDTKAEPPIGFAFTELAPYFGSLPPQEWSTLGLEDSESNMWLIKGKKNRILFDDNIENYLVFFRDDLLSRKIGRKAKDQEPNPAADPLIGACIVAKDQIKSISPAFYDSAGIKYVDVEFDSLVSKEFEVFPAKRKSPQASNIKGLGQVGSSAVIVGIMKDAQRRTYKYLLENKRGLLDCDLVKVKMTDVTNKIYAVESLVYYVAGMFDGLQDGFDAHLEAAITKILAIDYGFEVLRGLQQICGSDLFLTSRLQDQLNIMDSFLDSSLHNRIYIATLGVFWYARNEHTHLSKLRLAPWYPGYFSGMSIKEAFERNDWLTLDADIKGNLHPGLEHEATRLEFILKRIEFATDTLCKRYGSETPGQQSDLIRLSQLVVDCFMLTAVFARASRSYCNGSRNSESELMTCRVLSQQAFRNVKLYMQEIDSNPFSTIDDASQTINDLNLKFGGYYASPPIDVNV